MHPLGTRLQKDSLASPEGVPGRRHVVNEEDATSFDQLRVLGPDASEIHVYVTVSADGFLGDLLMPD